MPEPMVVRMMREWKAGLLRSEAAQMKEMARVWLGVERELEGSLAALAAEIDELRKQGVALPVGKLVRLERYEALLRESRGELGKYADYASGLIGGRQGELAALGASQAAEAIEAAARESGITASFFRLPVGAIETLVGFAGDGTPLRVLLAQSWPDAVEGLTNALVRAVALGLNPRATARAMRDGFGVGLNRALNVARTEQLRAYREAARAQYQASGLVIGYRRLAAKQERTCLACLMADGQFYELDEPLNEHPQGRCTLVPVLDPRLGFKPLEWETGRQWFEGLDEGTQARMMGSDVYEGWKNGAFGLEELVRVEEDVVWGARVRVARVNELVGTNR